MNKLAVVICLVSLLVTGILMVVIGLRQNDHVLTNKLIINNQRNHQVY